MIAIYLSNLDFNCKFSIKSTFQVSNKLNRKTSKSFTRYANWKTTTTTTKYTNTTTNALKSPTVFVSYFIYENSHHSNPFL